MQKQPLTVVKIGGNIIDNPSHLQSFLQLFAQVPGAKILVHGGGKLATRVAEAMGIQQQMVNGRRITNEATLQVVTMVYAGFINKSLVAVLQGQGCQALGLCGADAQTIVSKKRPAVTTPEGTIDYGFVGNVESINSTAIQRWLQQGITPVFSAITATAEGQLLNTNADTVAQSLATALSEHYQTSLVYGFEKPGVLMNVADDTSVIPQINPTLYQQLLLPPAGQTTGSVIFEGMIPKLQNAFEALHRGVQKVIIGHALHLPQLLLGTQGTTLQL
ncbi:MAG: acetylglutamate kinase [Bacteroidetes bacterium]|nr:MAG: acetylglutamate kinase [Bacteroidota bacterium]